MSINDKAINYIKSITAETITKANSGHLGSSLGGSSILFALFKDHYNFDVSDTDFLNRDRLVLSAGHVSPLYYTLLSFFGFDISLQDLKEFRQFGSKTPGHPEHKVTDAVEVSTGPLGQGVANAVGMAVAEKAMEERFNAVGYPIIDNYTYCYCGDGDLMEGVALEAVSLAGKLKLEKLILFYDCNEVTIDGSLSLASAENTEMKFRAMGWNVITVKKGNKYSSCTKAIAKAKKSKKPTIIIFKTLIGIGTQREGTSTSHSYVLTQEELQSFKKRLKIKDSFFIPSDVRQLCMNSARRGKLAHEKWNQMLAVYATSQPELYKQMESFFEKKKIDFEKILKNAENGEYVDMREENSRILNELSEKLPQMIGGTADLAPSTKVFLNNSVNFLTRNKRGRNIHYGVREHAMGAISNGIALYEDFIVFNGTFLAFSNYMIPAIRMSAMMNLPVIYTFTNDSLFVGEDGPSHQPIEQIAQLRSLIGLKVFRPSCKEEILASYALSFSSKQPTALLIPRQRLKQLDSISFKDACMGGYIILKAKKSADVVIYATGSEVSLALDVAKELEKKVDVSVVSMPCLEVFEQQSTAYKSKILQKDAGLKVVIEASNDNVWYKYLSNNDIFVNITDYKSSCPGDINYFKAGYNVKNILKLITKKIGK